MSKLGFRCIFGGTLFLFLTVLCCFSALYTQTKSSFSDYVEQGNDPSLLRVVVFTEYFEFDLTSLVSFQARS